jgi:hypothetical protein
MATHVLVLALAFTLAACGSSSPSPTQPSPTPTPTPSPTPPPAPTAPGESRWVITHRFASVEGPDNCWIRYQRQRLTGVVFSGLDATITRLDGSIRFKSPWFQDYVGTYSGIDFSTAGVQPLEGGGGQCPDGGGPFPQLPGTSNLTGRFAGDDQSLTGSEVNSYRLSTGEPVTYTWTWTGTRQN